MKQIFTLLLVVAASMAIAQPVTKTVVVEHFTNSRCGICASRNPAFFNNLAQHPNVLHLAIHPSSPYSSCIFSQHNRVENDARTNYYDIFGGTPRLIIQGEEISPGANYGSAALFTPYLEQSTPVSVRIDQTKTAGVLTARVVVKAEADNSIGQARLFLAAVEALIEYNAPNGESQHHNVFRRTFSSEPTGIVLTVPASAGDSLVATYSVDAHTAWNFEQMYVMAILQEDSDKSVIQAAASLPTDNVQVSSVDNVLELPVNVFPNPATTELSITLPGFEAAHFALIGQDGKQLLSGVFVQNHRIDTSRLPAGHYVLEVSNRQGKAVKQVVIR